jgi:single-strand DNA-binding protein
MSTGFSYAQVGGFLARDPEIRSTPSGVKVVNFGVGVGKGFGDKSSTSWFNVVCFKDIADFAEKYLKKGKSVLVSGDLQVRSWDDKTTGQKRTTTEIVAYKIDFMDTGGSKSESTPRSASPQARRETQAPAPRASAPEPEPFDEEPF